ncbi:MAG: hypothetical protein SFZ23_08935 [Planctomycetota bacterium]|nr:hypothetical protein [Planctomycetota bacterium]
MSVCKGIVRYGVIAGLVGGAGVILAGPDRVAALFSQTREAVAAKIDQNISDPVALRAQLRDLESQIPGRIADVQGDLAELRSQKSQLQHELAKANRVVELATRDLGDLDQMITRAGELAKEPGIQNASYGAAPVIRIRFNNESLTAEQAMQRANEVEQVRSANEARAADVQRDLGYIEQQEARLSDLLTQLEQERDSFQAQLFALDRQVDAIARNERMIEMMAKRQETIDRASRYRASSLDQVNSKFAEIRARQEAQLETLAKGATSQSYESRAAFELDARDRAADRAEGRTQSSGLSRTLRAAPKPEVIEVTPENSSPVLGPVAPRVD